jgi:soluble lytic murein transglycosylase-like protein
MESKHFIPICVFLLTTASSSCPAGQIPQKPLLLLNNHEIGEYYLSKKFLNGGQLKSTPVNAKLLSYYDNRISQSNDFSSQIDKLYTNRTYVVSSSGKKILKLKDVLPRHEYLEEVFEVSHEYNIDPLLLHAIAEVESHFDPKAISPAGARGLMQIMPSTARRFGMNNPDVRLFNPRDNLRISSNYLRSLHTLFGNNIPLILAAYNAGESAVIKYGNAIPPYTETQQYVIKVMKRYLELKELSYNL